MIRVIAMTTGCVVGVLVVLTGAAGMALGSTANASGFVKPLHRAAISQGFGCTAVSIEPVDHSCAGGHFHSGVDLAAAAGTPVYATASGGAHVLLSATGFGLHVVIAHGGGLQSLYGHLSAVDVIDGAYVTAGEIIGAVGSSGNSTGPHLHFEFDRGGVPQDPAEFVSLP